MIEIDMTSGELLSHTADDIAFAREEAPYDAHAHVIRLQQIEREYTPRSKSTLPVDLVNAHAADFVVRNENIR